MRKLILTMLAGLCLLLLASCGGDYDTPGDILATPPIANDNGDENGDYDYDYDDDDYDDDYDDNDSYTYDPIPRCDCGFDLTIFNIPRSLTPPLYIHEFPEDGFLEQFTNAYHFSFANWDTDFRSRLVFWADEPLTQLSFVSLDINYHMWILNILHFPPQSRRVEFTIDVLQPNEAFVLDVAFFHYLLPHGMITFVDASGTPHSMFISESMAGGCMASYHLMPFDDTFTRMPENRVNSAAPTAAQQNVMAQILGDFTISDDVIRDWHDDGEFAMYQRLLYHNADALDNAEDLGFVSAWLWPPLTIETTEGDAVFVFVDTLDAALLMIDLGYDQWGNRQFRVIEL